MLIAYKLNQLMLYKTTIHLRPKDYIKELHEKNAYEGKCPKCNSEVKVVIGPDGTDVRFFSAQ